MDYAALKTTVTEWLGRTDAAALAGTFVILAEQELYGGASGQTGLRLSSMLNTTNPFTPGPLPAGFLAIERVSWLDGSFKVPLEYRSSDQISERESNPGDPSVYTIRGGALVIDTTASVTIELLHYGKLTTPTADADENAIMASYPSVYLYGMLKQAAVWLGDTELLAKMAPLFADAMASAQRADDDSRRSRGPLRIVSDRSVRV